MATRTTVEVTGYDLTYTTRLVVFTCATCGVPFAIPEKLEQTCREHPDQAFYCPNGHQNIFPGKSREDLERELKSCRVRLRAETDQRQAAEADAERQRAAARRLRQRAKAGACPAPGCKRSISSGRMAQHLAAKHPDWHA